MSFAKFSAALSTALAASKVAREAVEGSTEFRQYSYQDRESPDMRGVFEALQDMKKYLGVSRSVRDVFRPYFVTAVFRAIVHDSSLVIDEETNVLRGVKFGEKIMAVEDCAKEISELMTLAKAPTKIRFTGGGRQLMTVPLYQNMSAFQHLVPCCSAGFDDSAAELRHRPFQRINVDNQLREIPRLPVQESGQGNLPAEGQRVRGVAPMRTARD